ncbi:MAG: phosphatase PAP2 family protein [Acidimicrobiales bacterium]
MTEQSDFDPGRDWAELARQILIVGLGVFLYFAVRGQTEGAESAALENGRRILEFEERIWLDWEMGLQSIVLSSTWLTTLSNWAYIWLHWPIIIISLIWLHRNRRLHYLLLRNAMFVSGLIGLAIFIRFPVAPPRMLDGFVDTVTDLSTSYRILQPPDLVNKYAAVPSLHVGWNLLVGVAVYLAVSNRWLRTLAVLSPIVMTFAVVATANHYVIDALIGIVVAGVGLAVAFRVPPQIALGRRLERRDNPEIVHDESVHTPVGEFGDHGRVVRGPRVEQTSALQTPYDPISEQTRMDYRAVDPSR